MKYVHNPIIYTDETFSVIPINIFGLLQDGRYSVSTYGNVHDNFYNKRAQLYLVDNEVYTNLETVNGEIVPFRVGVLVMATFSFVVASDIIYKNGNPLDCTINNIKPKPIDYTMMNYTYNEDELEKPIPEGKISDEDADRVYRALYYFYTNTNKRVKHKLTYPDIIELLKIPYDKTDPNGLRNLCRVFSSIKNREGKYRKLFRNYPRIPDNRF